MDISEPDQITGMPDDPWLIKSFKEFEKMPVTNRAEVDWSVQAGFQVFSEFLLRDIQDMRDRLKNAEPEYLYYVCQHIFNITDWMALMVADGGFPTLTAAFESLFEKQFGDRHILRNLYDTCFAKWMAQKTGQQKIGENFYNIFEGKVYYRDRFDRWFEVDTSTAFDIKPDKKLIHDTDTIDQLNGAYKATPSDTILAVWQHRQFQGLLPDDFLQSSTQETDPEAYFGFAIEHIDALLKNPISIAELERWNGGEIENLEDIVKISVRILDVVAKRRADDSHTIYLLRDSLIFYEANKILDILSSEQTSADQVLLGRKLLSHAQREWGYYVLMIESLYDAHRRYPANFEKFYEDYARLLDKFVSLNPGFALIISDLSYYIEKHIRTDKRIVIFDIGFQGSIALLTKYIIDKHVLPSGPNSTTQTDIRIGVGALWSKKLFGDRYESDYFPFLNRVQLLATNNDLYHFKSLSSGRVRVLMGDKTNQHNAAVELAVLVMVARLTRANQGSDYS